MIEEERQCIGKLEINKSSRMNLTGFAFKRTRASEVEELRAEQEAEVMDFLRERPAHTFGMAGFIRTNGLVSAHNRGSFYACRDKRGHLLGVALIGHYILFEACSDAAIKAFARLLRIAGPRICCSESKRASRSSGIITPRRAGTALVSAENGCWNATRR